MYVTISKYSLYSEAKPNGEIIFQKRFFGKGTVPYKSLIALANTMDGDLKVKIE